MGTGTGLGLNISSFMATRWKKRQKTRQEKRTSSASKKPSLWRPRGRVERAHPQMIKVVLGQRIRQGTVGLHHSNIQRNSEEREACPAAMHIATRYCKPLHSQNTFLMQLRRELHGHKFVFEKM